jgi:hypothetical protein
MSVTSNTVRGFVAAAALGAAACSSGPSAPDEGSYVEKITAERMSKERMFRDSPESPIPAAKQAELLPLRYFPVDSGYSTPAALKLSEDRPEFEMPTSTGKLRKMQPMSLGAFVEAGTGRITQLFVPFSDLTTGTETYAAGRYLDLAPTSTGLYEIDFNRAYNPYCAYNESYDCPYPPPSNRLKVPVRAGEQMPAGTAVPAADSR